MPSGAVLRMDWTPKVRGARHREHTALPDQNGVQLSLWVPTEEINPMASSHLPPKGSISRRSSKVRFGTEKRSTMYYSKSRKRI